MGAMFVLAASAAVAQPEPPTITCTGGVCLGTQGDDLILGTNDGELINAKGGTDGVNGLGGNDHVLGGPGKPALDILSSRRLVLAPCFGRYGAFLISFTLAYP